MSKQYVKCLSDKFGYLTKGKTYEVHRFNEHDSDMVYITDDDGDEVSAWVIEGQFELCDSPKQSSPEDSGITFNNTFYPVRSLSEMYALLDALHTIEEITQNAGK